MSNLQNLVVSEARLWIGTPYVHQCSVRGAGTDCLGLLRGVWRAIFSSEPEPVPAYSLDWSETQGEERLWAAALRHLKSKPADEEDPGDVVLFRMRSDAVAKHLGITSIVGPDARFIHAYSKHGVLESPFSLPWRRRVVARFQFPEEMN